MHRLFVGLELPETIKTHLSAMMGGLDGVRWQSEDQLHLTLRFIGEVERTKAEDIRNALSLVFADPFTVKLEGVGYFGKDRAPRLLWAGVANPAPLKHLHEKIDQALVRIGIPPENRKFKPHVTLARFRRAGAPTRLTQYLAQSAALSLPEFEVNRFILFESHLCSDGACYDAVETYPLGEEDLGAFDLDEEALEWGEIAWPEGLEVEQHRVEIV